MSYCIYMSTFVVSSENDTKKQSVTSRVNDNGRIVIPANIRKSMGLKPGDVVVMSLEDGVLRIESQLARIRRIQEEFKKFATPGTLASDELIADRREEARRRRWCAGRASGSPRCPAPAPARSNVPTGCRGS